MARMTKKTEARTALVEVLAARSAQLAERDANAAAVRGFIKWTKGDFFESEEDGKICFSGNYLTGEGMVSIIPWEISVSDDLVMLSSFAFSASTTVIPFSLAIAITRTTEPSLSPFCTNSLSIVLPERIVSITEFLP